MYTIETTAKGSKIVARANRFGKVKQLTTAYNHELDSGENNKEAAWNLAKKIEPSFFILNVEKCWKKFTIILEKEPAAEGIVLLSTEEFMSFKRS